MCLAGVAAAWHAPSARLPSPLRAPSSRATTAAAARATPDAAPAEIGLDEAIAALPRDCDPFDPSSIEFCSPGAAAPGSARRSARLAAYFALWYAFNIGYNIYNKRFLNAVPLPWTAATVQLCAGVPYVALLWASGLRKAPRLSLGNVRTLLSSAAVTTAGHVGGVISFGAGAISFTHIVKATEPVVSALLSAAFFREFLPLPVYLSMLPIVGGVGLASLKELSFRSAPPPPPLASDHDSTSPPRRPPPPPAAGGRSARRSSPRSRRRANRSSRRRCSTASRSARTSRPPTCTPC